MFKFVLAEDEATETQRETSISARLRNKNKRQRLYHSDYSSLDSSNIDHDSGNKASFYFQVTIRYQLTHN